MDIFKNAEDIIKDYTVTDRFLKYVKIDTQSSEESETFPSTEKQKDLLKILKSELEEIGLDDIQMDEYGYVTATLPANLPADWPKDKKVPVIGFMAHVDTSPDSSGENVNPIIHKNYQGGEIKLPKGEGLVLNYENSPNLKHCIGMDIITADGTTLLGADDKSGCAEIMDAMRIFKENSQIYHGEIKIAFTPDEEVGMGTKYFDEKKWGVDFAYTMDGGELGEIEIETFNADTFVAKFTGVSYHPGYAKGKLLNAVKMASTFIDML
ncbi:MAG: tripeptide aminopeptidase PepT, partial [Acidobacteria bacterium]|nr:tripeptide aminopeptidase PepT [Acidobacteriota bacterium]